MHLRILPAALLLLSASFLAACSGHSTNSGNGFVPPAGTAPVLGGGASMYAPAGAYVKFGSMRG